jgi:acyl-coenzyme A synthetase/AMP-(fatty) acid ligase
MPVAVKLRLRRRAQAPEASPLEQALAPAVRDGRWRVPDRFNFTRDVVEVLARDPKRRALTFVGADGIIEPRTFRELSEGANRWASILRDKELRPGDRVLVLSGATVDWVELVLGCVKAGVIVVPSPRDLAGPALESRFVSTGASLLVATDDSKAEIARMSFAAEVHHLFEGRRRRASDVVDEQPTQDTSARDIAFIAWTAGTTSTPKAVAHTHGSTFAARNAAEHWLDAGPGDVVWCTTTAESLQAFATPVFGAWARGAEVAIHDGAFDPVEHLELLHRFDVTIACQTPAEYRALAGRRELGRFRSRRLRRLVSTGDYLDPDVIASFEEAWATTIWNGYGQAETGIVVAHGPENDLPAESLGRALPGQHVGVVDDSGSELPAGVDGYLAVRDRPPTLFAGYMDAQDETRDTLRGDWYLTGDVAIMDEDGTFWFVCRAEDTITSRGRTFGPHEVERVLLAHDVVAESAVVGVPDLERGGHFVRAFVVPAPGVEGSEQLEAELRQSLGQSLSEQQVPREIEFIDELPTAPSGAVKRGELRERPVVGRPLWEEAPSSEDALLPPPEQAALAAFVAEPVQPHVDEELALPVAEPLLAPAYTYEIAVEAPEPDVEPVVDVPAEEPAIESPVEPPEPVEAFVEPSVPEPVEEPVAAEALPRAPLEEPFETAPELVAQVAAPSPPVVEGERPEPEPAPARIVEEPMPASPAAFEPETEPIVDEEHTEAGAVVELVPPPESPVDPTAEPLPDFVVPPSAAEQQPPVAPPPPPAPLEEEELDLGPLPEYIVDPERRLEPVASAPPEPDAPSAEPGDSPVPAFPSVPALDLKATLDARRESDEETPSPHASRRRPASSSGTPARGSSAAEPGDEAEETSWMKGLSSRLSAYSLDADSDEQQDEDAGDEPREKESD